MREQKIEKVKNIELDNYRQAKLERVNQQVKNKPQPNWYTVRTNIDELEPRNEAEFQKYGNYRKLRNIREQEEYYDADDLVEEHYDEDRRGEGEGSPDDYGVHRSISCKDFQYPKSRSYCFDGHHEYVDGGETKTAAPISILKKTRSQVPKSFSFSAGCRNTPFDMADYVLPPPRNSRRARQEAFRKSSGYFYSNSLDETSLAQPHTCCAREHCTNAKCFLDEMYTTGYHHAPFTHATRGGSGNWCRSGMTSTGGLYGAGASSGSNRNLHVADHTECWYDERNCNHCVAAAPPCYLSERKAEQLTTPMPPTVICCCAADDYCCHRQQQHHMTRSRTCLYCNHGHIQPRAPVAPTANTDDNERLHCRAYTAYDTDLDHFIRDERERLLLQDKFLDDDERYLSSYYRPARSKSPLPTTCYEVESCSDSTEMDLEDFNIDLEKYWEELEKPPSPIDLDMQRRNMHSNLKVKNINVGCYNNGQPIEPHDNEESRPLRQKNLLENMPTATFNEPYTTEDYNLFEPSPLHSNSHYNNCQKVYPAADILPTYKYNNFYPELGVQTQQPNYGSRHTSAGGNSALSLINNIFSIYKPNKYAAHNCQFNDEPKPEPCKKMNVPSTRRPLGAPHSEYMHSMKRPLIVSTEQPHFKIIPEKTGLKISPLYSFNDYGEKTQACHKLTSTARPLMLPH